MFRRSVETKYRIVAATTYNTEIFRDAISNLDSDGEIELDHSPPSHYTPETKPDPRSDDGDHSIFEMEFELYSMTIDTKSIANAPDDDLVEAMALLRKIKPHDILKFSLVYDFPIGEYGDEKETICITQFTVKHVKWEGTKLILECDDFDWRKW